ncbi:51L [Yaba monkey tumor virus]|uniref:Entry-fusion complex protein OPG086 n=1 Tax=Yaba monkey tumor virus (strain VR587) TaxID=928314 RepID=Q6TUW2_YMTV5|nr:Hypothetical protein YMTVg51L [Yaba monkey tumor virus]AAR07407.1 51L [Yaba monkey tumor virus]
MASLLTNLLFFIVFIIIAYCINYYPTNKLQMAVKNLNYEYEVRKQQDTNFPQKLNTIIFSDKEEFISDNVRAYYNASTGTVAVLTSSKKLLFNVNFDDDVSALLPILLLSK